MRLKDETSGQSISKRLHFAHPDLSSAEWIAEAPSNCEQSCRGCPDRFRHDRIQQCLGQDG